MTNPSPHTSANAARTAPPWVYKLMLVAAAAVWGLGTVVIKDTVDAFPPAWLIGIRFFCAGLILLAVCWRRVRRFMSLDTLKAGTLLGVILGFAYLSNTWGLLYTTASKSVFLTATYCVMVPFVAWALSRLRPTACNLAAALLCVAGIAFVAFPQGFERFQFGPGEILTMASAVLYAFHIPLVSKLSAGRDPMTLTIIQFLVGGLQAMVIGFGANGLPNPQLFANPQVMANLAYLIVFASCLALPLQNIGLAHVNPTPASLLLATESVFGVVFAVALLGDVLTPFIVIGFVLIGVAIVANEAFAPAGSPSQKDAGQP